MIQSFGVWLAQGPEIIVFWVGVDGVVEERKEVVKLSYALRTLEVKSFLT